MAAAGRSIAAVYEETGLVATRPGVNIINGGRGDRPWEAKVGRESLGTYACEEEAYEAYASACRSRGMKAKTERTFRPGNPMLVAPGSEGEAAAAPAAPSGSAPEPSATAGAYKPWTARELEQIRSLVAQQKAAHPGKLSDWRCNWAAIAGALPTPRGPMAVYQRWMVEQQKLKPKKEPVSMENARTSKRERKKTNLGDDYLDIDYLDQSYFDATFAAGDVGRHRKRKIERGPTPQAAGAAAAAAAPRPEKKPRTSRQGGHLTGWTEDEMLQLVRMVKADGGGDWQAKADALGTGRTGGAAEQKYYASAQVIPTTT